jgi:hypothetical protein
MSAAPVPVNPKSDPATSSAAIKRKRLFLALALGAVLTCRLALYLLGADRPGDFDVLYQSALRLLGGESPYPIATQWFPYPLPAVLLAVPFTAMPLEFARPIFDILAGWAFAYSLWRYRGTYALLAVASGAYLFSLGHGQVTPLIVAASLVPALGFLLPVKPNTAAALWIARPSRIVVLGMGAFLLLSLVLLPSWPREWWLALQQDNTNLVPAVFRPFGVVLVLAALRWRLPEARLLLAMAFIPLSALPHELVVLVLIPANLIEMGIFVAGSWIAVGVAHRMESHSIAEWSAASWPATLAVVYLPMLVLVLRRPSGVRVIEKERRRPYRIPDEELRIDVTSSPRGGVTVTVTHLPTRASAAESGPTRRVAERKAQDKLAGIVAGMRRNLTKEAS